MLEFNNNHIFTGFLKQLLSSFCLPACKVYTKEFAKYAANYGEEDPRIVESFDCISSTRLPTRVSYLKDSEVFDFFYDQKTGKTAWKKQNNLFYARDAHIPGLTRRLKSPGTSYDTTTHEYLGDFLRFVRDYYDINLMSLYNCFSNREIRNILFLKTVMKTKLDENGDEVKYKQEVARFDSNDSRYKIYALPVKLFENYTIAIDCDRGLELFCGLYKNTLDTSDKAVNLLDKTYVKVSSASFNHPFLYDKLKKEDWTREREQALTENGVPAIQDPSVMSRCDLLNREHDLKLFIKVPANCKSTITILEGDYRNYNDFLYTPGVLPEGLLTSLKREIWNYKSNHTVINFENKQELQKADYKLISRIQLLALNTGKSYPFSDRLIEYLTGSAATPTDGIHDNIQRAQEVMNQNGFYFKINGLWENQMQKIAYNYLINEGPFELDSNGKLIDKKLGRHPKLGYTSKSSLYDILGYIDKDVEKCYASWKVEDGKIKIKDTIQKVDIYNGLYNN